MIFSDPLFLFLFLPLAWTLWALATARAGRGNGVGLAVLVIASCVFYGWHHVGNLALFLCAIAFNFAAGIVAGHAPRRLAWLATAAAVAGNLILIATFKYYGFLTGGSLYLILPLAISFYTFQQIAYVVDSYRDRTAEGDPLRYLFFISFFPQLIAGPIVTYRQVRDQFGGVALWQLRRDNVVEGIHLLLIGLAKKVLLADTLAPVSDSLFSSAATSPGWTLAWLGTTAFYLQIYFDFSGYSDMALGIARLFNLRLPPNFASPYRAGSPIEFWRRWHMTLSGFLRDYLYKPLGGSRYGLGRTMTNLMLVMTLGGLWHGAAFTFVIWGALHGAALCLAHVIRRFARTPFPPLAGIVATQAVVFVGWILFRSDSLAESVQVLSSLLSLPDPSWEVVASVARTVFDGQAGAIPLAWLSVEEAGGLLLATLLAGLAIVWALPNSLVLSIPARTDAVSILRLVVLLAVTFVVLAHRAGRSSMVEPFIYFQF